MRPVVSVLIDLPAEHPYHRATLTALRHASEHRGIAIEVRVVPTDTIRDWPGSQHLDRRSSLGPAPHTAIPKRLMPS